MNFNSDPKIEIERARLIQAIASVQKDNEDPQLAALYKQLYMSLQHFGSSVNVVTFVQDYIKQEDIEIKPNGIFQRGQIVKNHKVLFHRIYQEWLDFCKSTKCKDKFSREDLALEFEAVGEDQWKERRTQLQKRLKPQPDSKRFNALLSELIEALCGVIQPDPQSLVRRRYMAFMGHFLWQLQMKLHFGPESILRQGNEAMLLIYSRAQKTGKSTAVRRILAPILDSGMVWKTDFERLMDPFSLQNLVYNYVAWFDDAGRAGIRNMEKFKQLVTESEVSYRAIYSQTEMKLPKFAVLIGTSNKPCRELMHDTTGLRRFHQIEVNGGKVHEGTGIDLDRLKDFPIEELIRSTPIGEEASPLYEYLTPEELSDYEEEQRPKHVIELWLRDEQLEPADEYGKVLPTQQLYDSLLKWCSNNGYSGKFVPTSTSLAKHLSEFGFIKGRTSKFRGFHVAEVSSESE